MQEKTSKSNIFTLFLIALSCVILSGLFGAITNMINGLVSPFYYKAILHWDFEDVWTAAVAQGIFEGLIYGILFSLIFIIGFALITKGKAPFSFAFKQMIKIIFIVFCCWTIGGLIAISLATLSPSFYHSHFRLAPRDTQEMVKFAWVGGSIWGGIIGGLLSTILGIVVIKNNWTKEISDNL